jgi:hypothetical protein
VSKHLKEWKIKGNKRIYEGGKRGVHYNTYDGHYTK